MVPRHLVLLILPLIFILKALLRNRSNLLIRRSARCRISHGLCRNLFITHQPVESIMGIFIQEARVISQEGLANKAELRVTSHIILKIAIWCMAHLPVL